MVTGWTLNNLSILPPANYNGSFDLTVVASATEISTGLSATNSKTLKVNVLPVADAIVAQASTVTGIEDTAYIFKLADFKLSNPDNIGIASVSVSSLPVLGTLQYLSGTTWVAVTVNQTIGTADMTAGKLRFVPKSNESGFDGYGTAGVGNQKQDYANLQFAVIDSLGVKSNLATLTIDVPPVADAPVITLATVMPLHSYSETFESYGDIYGTTSTTQVNGWTAIAPNQIEILKESTYLGNTSTNRVLEIEGPVGGADVYKDFATYPGELFTLSLSYSPRKGNTTGIDSAIDVFWEGVKIGTLNSTTVGLKTYSFNVTATSANSLSRLQFHAQNSNSYGGVIDNISLIGKGFNMGAAIPLNVAASLSDSDGSESLSLAMQSIPVGAKLTDGSNSFTATATNSTASLTGWNLANLKIQPTLTQTTSFTLTLVATATESVTGTTASTAAPMTVNLGTLLVSPIVLDLNGDGIKTTRLGETTGKFDLLNNGTPVESGWLSSDDGFLAIDRNGNGKIDSRAELFGGEVGEGFATLASLDSNGDYKLNGQDERFNELLIWQDKNGNHQTDAGELRTLKDWGITELNTNYTNQAEMQNQNLLLERSNAIGAFGKPIDMVDVYFQVKASLKLDERLPVDIYQSRQVGANREVDAKVLTKAQRPAHSANGISVTVCSVLPTTEPIQDLELGRAVHEFAGHLSEHSIRLTKPMATKDEWSEEGNAKDSETGKIQRFNDRATPVIDWNLLPNSDRNLPEMNVNGTLAKHRKPKWAANMVSGACDKPKQNLIDALTFSLPSTATHNGK